MNKKLWAAEGGLCAAALFLRFALRGYAWWGYACLFAAALLLLHRFLPAAARSKTTSALQKTA